jgi:UDP-N-acetylmuramate--alanine ligase
MDEFPGSFSAADKVFITDIYPASESPIDGVSGEALAERIAGIAGVDSEYAGPCNELPSHVPDYIEPGDLIVTMGAGSIGRIGHKILERLRS